MRVKPTVPKHPIKLSPSPSNTTASPPLSPSPYDASSEDESHLDTSAETDTQRELDESFFLVRREDDEVSTSSTIGTSLRDSMIAELSDTSAGSVSGDSITDDIPDPFAPDDESSVALDEAASMIEGSYTEADIRTDATGLADSRSTLQESAIQFIFPDPVASFTSSAGASSDGTTPNGSLANLIRPDNLSRADTIRLNAERIDRLTRGSSVARGVDEGWLQNSRMWSITPEMEKMMEDIRPYQRLGSNGDGSIGDIAKLSPGPFAFAGLASDMEMPRGDATIKQRQEEWKKVIPPPSPSPASKKALDRLAAAKVQRSQDARRALMEITSATLGSLGKKWGIVAIASMLSLALLGTVGPTAVFSFKAKQSPTVTSASTLNDSASSSLVDQIVPDLLSIKQAISSFSTATQALVPDIIPTGDASLSVVEKKSGNRCRRTQKPSSDRSVSVRSQDVALTVRSTPVRSLSIIPQKLRERIVGRKNESCDAPPNATVAVDPLDVQPMKRISDALFMAKNYSLSAYHHMDLFYGPILAALERELGELYRLTRKLVKVSSAASRPALESASNALLQAQRSLDRASHRVYDWLRTSPPEINKEAANQAIDRAQAGLHLFTEFVEGQATAIQEQSGILLAAAQEKSLESLKQARRGLDRMIDMLGGEKAVRLNVEKDGPMPFDKMSGGCAKCRKESRERNRRKRHVEPKRSRWSRVQEAFYYAVPQLVL